MTDVKVLNEKERKLADLLGRGVTHVDSSKVIGVHLRTIEKMASRAHVRAEAERIRDKLFGRTDDIKLLTELQASDDPTVAMSALKLKAHLGIIDLGSKEEEFPDGAYVIYRKPLPPEERVVMSTDELLDEEPEEEI